MATGLVIDRGNTPADAATSGSAGSGYGGSASVGSGPAQTGYAGPMPSGAGNVGMIPVVPNAEMVRREEQAAADERQARPEIVGLAGYVRTCWAAARDNKEMTIEPRMMQALRMRNGEYDPSKLTSIRAQGGTEIYMMLGSSKARAASSWLRDTLLGTGVEKTWTITPTKVPDINPQDKNNIMAEAAQRIQQFIQMMGVMPEDLQVRQMMTEMKDGLLAQYREEAMRACERMEHKMEDQLQEGAWLTSFHEFLDDITTFPAAFLKGPVVRKKKRMKWLQDGKNGWKLDVAEELVPEWDRVDPFMIYPAPHSRGIDDGYLIERHQLTRSALHTMIGVEGYDDAAIREVLAEYGKGGLREWLQSDAERAEVEGRNDVYSSADPEKLIDAIEFHGSVSGQHLLDFGMKESEIPDPTAEYDCCVWLIGRWVIKAQLNYNPLGKKPYYKASYETLPGQFWGNSTLDLIKDTQDVCNAAARAIVNNMGIASGPQVAINVERLPDGQDVTQMHPWKIWQFTSDPLGGSSTAPAVDFFAPPTMVNELMAVYEKFSSLADEYSGIPRYMTGNTDVGGAARTASGMSMMMGNASKIIKQVVQAVDVSIIKPVLENLYFYNMRYSEDDDLKGDVNIVARGATSILQKEAAQVRRNEFLGMVLNSPVVSQIAGQQGIAELLRQSAKTLDMPNIDKIIPSNEQLARQAMMQQQMAMQQMQMEQAAQGGESIEFQRDENGQMTAAKINRTGQPSQSGQNLQNGAPVTDNFSPAQGA